MATRKSPSQRVEEYRTKAAEIEKREARKLLAKSPHWMAITRAISNLQLAHDCLRDEERPDGDESKTLGDVVVQCITDLEVVRDETIG